ncbi:arylamine N-acetyltransferase 1 [Glonium stellatum]|uniref:Arylamine N-acetyltransferase 1 n=1 Tax=Glonium stellatum TaxID=574774 RepID=A0A8E2JYH8_9PEZI|nr:arylamine N-acetyltransferase 1 [Glonium stellatum]
MQTQERPVYTKVQLDRYFDRLKLPTPSRKYDVSSASAEDALEYLSVLQKHHLAAIPFENLTLHYSPHRQISLRSDELYKKIVESDGRGGYCMENSCIFGILLRSLGFQLYSAGARVKEGEVFNGWNHMINLVKIGEHRYVVDVGFGPNGPIHPLKLDRSSTVSNHISPASMRLQWKNIVGNTNPDQRLWVYEHKINDKHDFEEMYCFTELEFLPSDYEIMNYYTSTSLKVLFTQKIVCAKMLIGGPENDQIIGVVILQNDVKWRIHGEKKREQKFESEEDRLKALDEVFGIKLSPVERECIKGTVSEIKKQ